MPKRKVDITIIKAATFNTGNFCSVKPEISITLKDISSEDVISEYSRLNDLTDALFGLNMISHLEEMDAYSRLGKETYLEALQGSKEDMEEIVRRYSDDNESLREEGGNE